MRRIIEAEKLNEEKVVIESTNDFEESAFHYVYQKAEQMLEDIIQQNVDEFNKDNGNISFRKQIMNLVAFEGRRGTGKTSVMLSVAGALSQSKEVSFLNNIKKNKSVSFTVLDCIDASLLEDNEDVLEIVLANMFSKLREWDSSQNAVTDFEMQELYSLFDEVYGFFLSIHGSDKNKEMSPIRVLTNLSNSQTLEKKIEELVDKYLKCMARITKQHATSENHFLVISIDDLDMRLADNKYSSPYLLLETLRRYLMIPGIIILLTYNYKDLHLSCVNHFAKLHQSLSSLMQETGQNALESVTEYLDKVIPIYARIHMPSLRNRDYVRHDILLVKLKSNDADQVMRKFRDYLWGEDKIDHITISVKKFALLLKADVAGLYYDACGNKRHFAEPRNLRQLTQIFTFCKQLNQIGLPQDDKENAVFKELLDDLYYRFSEERLTWNEQEKLTSFLDVPIERRSRDIVGDIKEGLKREGIHRTSRITNAKLSYSYGELLYFLYLASSDGIYSKSFICCILDSYTIMLTKTYLRLCRAMDEKKHKDSSKDEYPQNDKDPQKDEEPKIYKDCLLDVIGSSVASSWSNMYIPFLSKKEDVGNEDTMIYNVMDIAQNQDNVSIGAIRFDRKSSIEWDYVLPDTMTLEEAGNQLRMLEILCMFFSDVYCVAEVPDNIHGFKIIYCPQGARSAEQQADGTDILGDSSGKNPACFKISFCACCFNIMNFVRNLFDGEEFFNSLHRSLLKGYGEYLKVIEKMDPAEEYEEAKTKAFFEQHSLKKNYLKWAEGTYGLAMPVYSLDMMYNILKRQYKKQKRFPAAMSPDNGWNYVRTVYENIGELLKEEDEFYYSDAEGKIKKDAYHFYKAYAESPFIAYVEDICNDEHREGLFKKRFGELILILANSSISGGITEDDLSAIRDRKDIVPESVS